jgi:hypothetical protein
VVTFNFGSEYDIMYIEACIQDSNETPTAMPMYSGSGYKTRLMQKQLDVWIGEESKIPNINCWLTDAMFNSQPLHKSVSLRSSLFVLSDLGNMGTILVETSLLSCVHTEMFAISYHNNYS